MIIIFPLGFLLGFPFPKGLEMLKNALPFEVPWAWSINAITSVSGSILAMILAFNFGYSWVLFIGSMIYALLFFIPRPIELK